MANNISTGNKYEKINKLINSSRFNEAILLLKNNLTKHKSLSKYLERLYTAETNYKYLLDYLSEGHTDPSRFEMLQQVSETLYLSNEALKRAETLIDSSDIYSSTKRIIDLRNENIESLINNYKEILEKDKERGSGDIILSREQSEALNSIFNYIWTLHDLSPDEYEKISSTLEDTSFPEYYKSLVINGLILANISYFDPNSFEILINQYDSHLEDDIRARLIVGIMLIALKNAQRIAGNIRLRSRLMLAVQEGELQTLLNIVLLSLIKTYDTTRIDKKIRTEVIPGLMKINPEIIEKMRNMASDSESILSDENPNWEEMFENSEIGEKLQEMNDMQMEGADVMVTAFSNLKSFPFFNNISNWFLPFIPGHYEFSDIVSSNEYELINNFSSIMCDSDIYSFLLSIKSLPEDKRNAMFENIGHQMQEAKEALSNSIGETEEEKIKKRITRTLQDIYRFFKFYRKKEDLNDPFDRPILSNNISKIKEITGLQPETIRLASEFYFKNKYYQEAADMFEYLEGQIPDNYSIWEKIGYSYDMMKNPEKAADWYKKAEIINGSSKWLTKKIAVSLKNSGNFDEAVDYYEKALEDEPENFHLLMSASQCYIEKGDYEKARKHLYHAQYIKPDKASPKRALAWTELLTKNLEKACELYASIIENHPGDKTDVLNMAHATLADGKFKEALRLYRRYVDMTDTKDITLLLLALKEDANILKTLGINTKDLRLIVDKIRYDME